MNNVPLWQYKREDDSALHTVFSSPFLVICSKNLSRLLFPNFHRFQSSIKLIEVGLG